MILKLHQTLLVYHYIHDQVPAARLTLQPLIRMFRSTTVRLTKMLHLVAIPKDIGVESVFRLTRLDRLEDTYSLDFRRLKGTLKL